MRIVFLFIIFFASPALSCPKPGGDQKTFNLTHAINNLAFAHIENGIQDIGTYLNKADKLDEPGAKHASGLFKNYTWKYGSQKWPQTVALRFLIELSIKGSGYASYRLANLFGGLKDTTTQRYFLERAVAQQYPPAYLEFALFLSNPENNNWGTDRFLNDIPMIKKYFRKAINLKCRYAQKALTRFQKDLQDKELFSAYTGRRERENHSGHTSPVD